MSVRRTDPADRAAIDVANDRVLAALKPLMDDGTIIAIELRFMTVVGDQGCIGGYVGQADGYPGALESMRELAGLGIEPADGATQH